MKYGETLRQRSTPEWAHYNIDYDVLKDKIKHHTTAGTSRALSIPGQGDTSEKAFGTSFYADLKAQHDRINLFVKTKSGEIQRRLDYIQRTLYRLPSKTVPGRQFPASIVEQYAKIDADINKAGEEIRALSRYQVVQRTGFRKILKKYKRWTKDADLERRFSDSVTSDPKSFYQLDVGALLDQYIEALGTLRADFDAASIVESPSGVKPSLPTVQIAQACQQGRELDFDVAFSMTPLGAHGNKATYWIHQDHVVEAELLLLQHMRLIGSSSPPATRGSPGASPSSRRSSSASSEHFLGSEDGVGVLVLDHPESFAIKQNALSMSSGESTLGTLQVTAAGNARWTSAGDAVLMLDLENKKEDCLIAKMDRDNLRRFLDTSKPLKERKLSNSNVSRPDPDVLTNARPARQWLEDHEAIKPIVGICSKRTRFMGLNNNGAGGWWATLDREVFMNSTLHKELDSENWMALGRSGSNSFPHAILEIRKEGPLVPSLIKKLDKSHLMERVRGFSIQAHAVWTCCRPSAMSAPIWVPILDRDIRKLPPAVKRQRRRADSSASSGYQAVGTSGSSTPVHTGPSTPLHDTSGTSINDVHEGVPPLRAFRKKKKRSAAVPEPEPEPEPQRYWNEYDNPEEGYEGYYIYIDPNYKYPGQDLFESIATKIAGLFGVKESSVDEESFPSTPDSSDDEDSPITPPNGYGTFGPRREATRSQGYFSGLFGGKQDPQQEVEALLTQRRETAREHRSLLRELESRRSRAGKAKLHFYTTCMAMAFVIDALLGTMVVTSRKKEIGVVDIVVLMGAIINLVLGMTAVISMQSRTDRLGWVHRGLVYGGFTAIVVIDILFVIWVFRGY